MMMMMWKKSATTTMSCGTAGKTAIATVRTAAAATIAVAIVSIPKSCLGHVGEIDRERERERMALWKENGRETKLPKH